MMGRYMLILFAFLVEGVSGDAAEVKSVNDGDPVILNSGVIKQHDDIVRWYFNNTLIALINRNPNETCLYDGPDGRFRDRLMLDVKTASLIITNSTAEHTGDYEAKYKREDRSGKITKLIRDLKCESTKIITKDGNPDKTIKSVNLTVSAVRGSDLCPAVPGSGLSSGVVAGIVVGVLLWAAVVVGVIYLHHRRSRNEMSRTRQIKESTKAVWNTSRIPQEVIKQFYCHKNQAR